MKQWIKPASEELKVFRPDGSGYLSAEGEQVELDIYWHRRIDDGDVVIFEPKPAKAAKADA